MGRRMNFELIIDRFERGHILVIGDIMIDRFIWGRVSRISPEAPVPVVLVERETFLLGGAANVVHNIHALGGKVSACGVVGSDEIGRMVLRDLSSKGIQTDGIVVEEGRQTTVKTRIIAHQQQVVRIDRETTEPPNAATTQKLSRFLKDSLEDYDGVVLSDYGKGVLTRELIRRLIRKARGEGKFVLVDPKLKNFFYYKGATVVTPNTSEASAAAGIAIVDFPSLVRAGKGLLRRLRCDFLVITRGEEGMAIFEPQEEPFLVPTVAREVYDVTGAGDTVIATMALALAGGAGAKEAAALANHAAGIAVGKVGTATVSREELRVAVQRAR